MRTTLTALLLTTLAAHAEGPTPPLARARIAGELSGIVDLTVDGKTSSSADFATPGGLKAELRSGSSLSPAHTAAVLAKLALHKEGMDDLIRQLKDKKIDAPGFKKAMDRLRAENKERGQALTVAEGTLALVDGRLRLTGAARALDGKKLDRDMPVGGAVIEGEAKAGRFKYDKDKEASLAIQNGALPILVVGKAAGGERKGRLRVTGVLRRAAGGELILDATKVEAAARE